MAPARLIQLTPQVSQPLSSRDDDALMVLSQAGSREAFAVLVERYAVRVIQITARFTGNAEQAEELAQSTWVAVWENRAQYRAGSDFIIWLVTVARNRCRNELRRRGVVQRHVRSAPQIDAETTPEVIDAILVEERRHKVRAALDQLPAPMREALLLRYAEELRYDEISNVVGIDESTLRSRVHHGLKLLKRNLEKLI